MNHILHLSKLDFLNRINEIAFQQNKQPIEVEKQYYFSLLWKLIQQYMTKVEFNKSFQDEFIIDGSQLNIHQNFLDWKFLCNYLFNIFETYNLRFDFNLTTYQEKEAIRCILYYESILDEKTKSISFILLSDTTATHADEEENDNKNSSGGSSLERIKLNIKAMKNFAEKAAKLTNEKINILNDKQFKNFINAKRNEFNFSKKDLKEINMFLNVTKSVIKNNILSDNRINKTIEDKINNTFINKPFIDKKNKINQSNNDGISFDEVLNNSTTQEKNSNSEENYGKNTMRFIPDINNGDKNSPKKDDNRNEVDNHLIKHGER